MSIVKYPWQCSENACSLRKPTRQLFNCTCSRNIKPDDMIRAVTVLLFSGLFWIISGGSRFLLSVVSWLLVPALLILTRDSLICVYLSPHLSPCLCQIVSWSSRLCFYILSTLQVCLYFCPVILFVLLIMWMLQVCLYSCPVGPVHSVFILLTLLVYLHYWSCWFFDSVLILSTHWSVYAV